VRNAWIRKSDSFKAFCLDRLQEDYENQVTREVLSKEYIDYCKANRSKIMDAKHIRTILTEMFGAYESRIRVDEDSRIWVWKGISLKALVQAVQAVHLLPPYTKKNILYIEGEHTDCADHADQLIKKPQSITLSSINNDTQELTAKDATKAITSADVGAGEK
jgi:hypothetical protein